MAHQADRNSYASTTSGSVLAISGLRSPARRFRTGQAIRASLGVAGGALLWGAYLARFILLLTFVDVLCQLTKMKRSFGA